MTLARRRIRLPINNRRSKSHMPPLEPTGVWWIDCLTRTEMPIEGVAANAVAVLSPVPKLDDRPMSASIMAGKLMETIFDCALKIISIGGVRLIEVPTCKAAAQKQ